MVARAEIALHVQPLTLSQQRPAREHVVEAPADVPLAHLAPRRPPREEITAFGI